MKKEHKELLIKDLCARLPYGVKCKDQYGDYINVNIYNAHIEHLIDQILSGVIQMVLRPMSSMTEDESAELSNIINEWFDKELFYLTEEPFLEYALSRINYSISPKLFDWLNAHHFDYRGLIPKGLAIEETEEKKELKEPELCNDERQKTISAWVARDEDGVICIYTKIPRKYEDTRKWMDGGDYREINSSYLPEGINPKWEDEEATEVELIIRSKK